MCPNGASVSSLAARKKKKKRVGERTWRRTAPKPLMMLSTSSRPNVLLSDGHLSKAGSAASALWASLERAISRHRSSRTWYASRAAGRSWTLRVRCSLLLLSSLSSSSAGTSTSITGKGLSSSSSSGAAAAASSSPTDSKTNMNIWRSVADAVDATTAVFDIESLCESSSARPSSEPCTSRSAAAPGRCWWWWWWCEKPGVVRRLTRFWSTLSWISTP